MGLGENKFFKSKIVILIPLETQYTVSVQICLDSREISVSKQIWLKNQSSPFSKWFMGFVNILEWIVIQIEKFPKSMIILI